MRRFGKVAALVAAAGAALAGGIAVHSVTPQGMTVQAPMDGVTVRPAPTQRAPRQSAQVVARNTARAMRAARRVAAQKESRFGKRRGAVLLRKGGSGLVALVQT